MHYIAMILAVEKLKEVMEGVSAFSLAANSKYIVYTSGPALYAGSLSDGKIINSEVIYKGTIGSSFWWNKDGKKIVFQGDDQGNRKFEQFVAEFK
jgi:hypothetical protein